jgi:hypothetical protein
MCYVVGCGVDYEEILLDGGDVVSWMALFCVAGLFFIQNTCTIVSIDGSCSMGV